MKNNYIKLFAVAIIILGIASCAPKGYESEEAGFFSGLWHGFIIVFSLIGKLFGAKIGIYAENNTGFTYWLGFILGTGILGGSSRL